MGVSLRFKKKVETEETKDKEVTGISVVHLPENDKAQVVADTENVKEKEFEFQTDGFSVYVVTVLTNSAAEINGEKFDTLNAALKR